MNNPRARAVVIKDNKILLIHRFKDGAEYYVLPGGQIEKGESPEETAIRELKEETTIDSKLIKKLGVVTDSKQDQQHIFLFEYISGIPKLEKGSQEIDRTTINNTYTPVWLDLDRISSIVMWPEDAKKLIEKCLLEN